MSAVSMAPESRRLEEWEAELTEVRAMTEREMENLVTEDDTPVDNILSEKQQRLLTEPLYSAWAGPEMRAPEHRGFLALANVGLFYALRQPPLVPDVMLALDIPGLGPDLSQKGNRSYFVWVQDGKQPAVVVEIVFNQEGGEDGDKLRKYEAIGVSYYVIFDPWRLLSDRVLRIYQFAGASQGYIEQVGGLLDTVGLGLSLWQGEYEGTEALWLRWTDREGRLIPTGAESAEQEHQRAEQEHQRATEAERRVERLAARLRELGIEPEE